MSTFDEQIADRIIEVMNRAVAADPKAVKDLCELRVDCNAELAADPTIQVLREFVGGVNTVGLIGILNGIAGILGEEAGSKKGWGLVAASYQVRCPDHGVHLHNRSRVVGSLCTVQDCLKTLALGELLGFRRSQDEDVKPRDP